MFSNRLPWPHRENRLTEAVRRRRAAGKPVLDLTESNPTRAGLAAPAAEIAAALSADPAVAAYAPDPRGLAPARAAVSAWLGARGRTVAPDRLFLTSSTSEAYSHLFKVLCEPGDSVLVPQPSYPLFEHLARLDAVRAVPYPLDADHAWRPDPAALASAFESSRPPRAAIVVNPNNPTGTAIRAAGRTGLDRLCAAHGAAVISDEVFFEYLFAPDPAAAHDEQATADPPISFAAAGPREALTFTLGGLSKAGGLPQMKLGWIAATGPERLRDEALERLEFVGDAYLSVSTPVQLAAGRLLEIGDRNARRISARVRENRTHLASLLHPESACRLLPGDGGWSAVLRVPAIRSEEELVLLLVEEDGVLVHPGYFFDFPGEAYLVVSLLPEPDTFRRGLENLLRRASA